MKRIMSWIGIVGFIFLLAACAAQPETAQPSEAAADQDQAAQEVLASYLDALHNGRYEEAAGLYGGSYEVLLGYNPDIDPNDKPALLEAACTINGFVCLEVKSIEPADPVSESEFAYNVQFANADGSLFELGPCCGADETSTPPTLVFSFTVKQLEDGGYMVMDLPPYTP